MPVIAQHVIPTAAGYDSPHYAADLYRYAHLSDHAAVQALLSPGGSPRTINLPVDAHHRQIPATMQGSYFADYYGRIHVRPAIVDLGNVISAQQFPVWVFNAHLAPISLQAINGLAEGIILSGQAAPPLEWAALQEREYQVSVTPEGRPVIDSSVTFDFGSERPFFRIIGNRIVAFTFAPNWDDPISERLSWLTDVLRSESMATQRRALRTAPRREFSAKFIAYGRDRQSLDSALLGWGSMVWALPIWPDVQLLEAGVSAGATSCFCSTSGRDFSTPGLAMFRGESAQDFEVVEVIAVTPTGLTFKRAVSRDWPDGSRLYPVRRAILADEPQMTRLTDMLAETEARFTLVEPCDWPTILPEAKYRGRPVLESRPDESKDLTWKYERMLSKLDNKTGIPGISDIARVAMPVMSWRWIDCGRDRQSALRSLLYGLRGQQIAIWVPTHADDLTVVEVAPDTSKAIVVANVGYSRFCQGRAGRKDIRIEFFDGSVLHRRIVSAGELDSGRERLELDAPHGRQLDPADISRVCFMVLVTLASDKIEWTHHTDADGVAEVSLTFRGVRDDDIP